MTLNGRTARYCTNDASFGAHHENLKENIAEIARFEGGTHI